MKRQTMRRVVVTVLLLGLAVWAGLNARDALNYLINRAQDAPGWYILAAALNVVFLHLPFIIVIAPLAEPAFGLTFGLCYLVIGETLGATFWFLVTRYCGLPAVNQLLQRTIRRKLLPPIKELHPDKTIGTLLAARAVLPLPLLGVGVALMDKMPLWKFLMLTALVSIPVDAGYMGLGPVLTLPLKFSIPGIAIIVLCFLLIRRWLKANGKLAWLDAFFPRLVKVDEQT